MVGVICTEHIDSGFGSELLWVNVHVPSGVKLTVPVGMLVVPGAWSAIVAVQLDAWLMTTVAGVQETVTIGTRRLIARLVLPELTE